MTALHWAVYHDDLPTATLLVKAGANAKAANRYGVTPLSLACTNGNTEIVELLLKAGADRQHDAARRRDGLDDRRAHGKARAGEGAARARSRGQCQGPEGANRPDVGRGRRPRGRGVRRCSRPGRNSSAPLPSGLYALALCRAGRPHRRRARSAEGGGRRQRSDSQPKKPFPEAPKPGTSAADSWRSRTAISSWRSRW